MFTALHAAKQFRQAIVPEIERGLKEGSHDPSHRLTIFVQSHSMGDQRVFVWPYRAAVVAQRIERGFVVGKRTPSPAACHVFAHQPLDHFFDTLWAQGATEQKMARIR